jgi:hypothetical protein
MYYDSQPRPPAPCCAPRQRPPAWRPGATSQSSAASEEPRKRALLYFPGGFNLCKSDFCKSLILKELFKSWHEICQRQKAKSLNFLRL